MDVCPIIKIDNNAGRKDTRATGSEYFFMARRVGAGENNVGLAHIAYEILIAEPRLGESPLPTQSRHPENACAICGIVASR